MVKLFCAVVGVAGSAFEVDIAEDASVSALKEAIKNKKKNALDGVDPDDLQLFLAKKKTDKGKGKGPWLVTNEVESGWRDTSDLKPLNAAATLNLYGLSETGVHPEVAFTEDDADAGRMPVHVLVVVPEETGGSVREASRMDILVENFQKLNDKLDKTVLGKRKVCHSSASSSLLDDLHVRVVASRAAEFKTEKHIDPYAWQYVVDDRGRNIKLTEEQNCEGYREYVEVNLRDVLKRNELCVYGVEKEEDILSVDVPGHNIKLSGRTDLIVLSDQVLKYPHELKLLPGVRLIIEVKVKVEPRSIPQAVSELVALDIMTARPVMALLTDFVNHWEFFWVVDPTENEGTINSVTISDPSEAFAVIRTVLDQSPSAGAEADITLPCFQEPIKRQKISRILASIGEGGGTSIRESIERYYDIASMLGPDIQMARAVASQITRSIPTLSYLS
ncbi:hypothetical protein P3T76_015147 [Phytophthora citrophthora]|uniref:Crinkler effector protein N-terminal domain-containing protein n=1 Tax=Phytophthora citrophthora TaxID=4793 RepID=A0AAD9G0F2_9STRA|nr:hypothetical protein P3T76_015147 [Phytophthora citrophthora]